MAIPAPASVPAPAVYDRDLDLNPGQLGFELGVRSDAKRIPAEALMDRQP